MNPALPLLRRSLLRALGILGATLTVAQAAPVLPTPALPRAVTGMNQKDMTPQPRPVVTAPKGAPNVVVVLLDDVGFGAAGTFGGLIPTPTLDHLAADGLRYNNFHTTGICSPTRASLLTGRNSHAVGVGNVMNSSAPYPGRNGFMPASAATIAEVLRQNGYATSLWGKWHLTPHAEETSAGPFDRWPTGKGFERFYGFLDGETHQFEPTLVDGVTPVARPKGDHYHLTEDITTRAIAWMRQQKVLAPEKPFFAYYAPGATHAPFHAPKEWIDKFRGQFDQGWDKAREEIFARQKKLGVIPADAQLTPPMKELQPWKKLTPERKRIVARIMETYAGFLAHTDDQIGRMVTALKDMGEFDNTLFFYIVGDNGASGEGSLQGTLNEMGSLQGVTESDAQGLARLDEIGGTRSYPHYPAGWAWAMNTPFQWTKQVASHLGGIRNPMVVSWPKNIRDKGGLRSQFSFVSDIMPTILEAAGIAAPAMVNGVPQQAMDGTSLVYSFNDARAPARHTTQYFEIFGNRSIYHQGWMASAFHGRAPWSLIGAAERGFDNDTWELYHLDQDFSQARDLAQAEPGKLAELQNLFLVEAARNQVFPLQTTTLPSRDPRLGDRTHFVFHAGFEGIAENAAPRTVGRSHQIVADLQLPKTGAEGVIAAMGGAIGGWSLYINRQGQPVYAYNLFGVESTTLTGQAPLPAGPVKLALDFAYDGGGYGKGALVKLRVNGKSVAEGRLKRTAPVFFSIDENFDIGADSGSPVGDYPNHYAFTGQIDKVTLDLK
ncbi:arylsulfatase [Denitratisoma sp. DHT3]|uniref:arylsulfatase n=1 Tax=Denitratisoma sp. DHT3 TaxID=1981880 RepID=UPI001198C363|nr:arylsulfatase [Denitratisoma sp. DHT3]QDX82686.1 arylsulfatase [Denitratisoma sp. DHT3]